MITFTLNGQPCTYDGDPELPLLNYLRDVVGITSPKDGCAPQAACGCCAVELNQKAVLSCVTPMNKVAEGSVTTIEGLGEYRQNVFANAFVGQGGVQCGFCIPGIVMQANTLIDQNPEPSRADIEKALTPHLCRCTGYKKIVDAIEVAAHAIRHEEEVPRPVSDGKVGSRQPKYDSFRLVLGQRPYVADLRLPGMLFGVLKFSDHPRAVIKKIDVSAAATHPGVIRIFTAEDIPGNRFIGLIKQDWPLMLKVGDTTRYVGDVLAGVVAESEAIARQAVELIRVEYDILEPIVDMHQALKADSPTVHPPEVWSGNVLSQTVVNRGDFAAAHAQTTHISRGVYQTQTIEHGFMEPECAIGLPDEDGVFVYSQSQGVFEDQIQIAKLLGLDKAKVKVELVPNGGGFGGKEDLTVQGHAALFAYHLQCPVRVGLTRDESILMHPKRHPLWMDYEVGCDANGKLTYLKANIVGDTGAYASVGMKVLERAAGHATGAYYVPAVDVVSTAVYTNNIPNGAMRGFGVNQSAFAVEGCIDDLCEKGGFDRWQFRYDNALTEGLATSTGQVLEGGVGVRETLLAVKDQFYAAKYAGIACGIKNTGIGNGMPDTAKVKITIAGPDHVIVDHGWTEMGQGVHTMAVQALCQETNLPPDIIEVRVNTTEGAYSGMTTASRATSLVGNAIIDAAKALRADLEQNALADLVGKSYFGEWICDWTTKPGAKVENIYTHYSYSYATQVVILNDQGQIQKIVAAHDAGKIFNPTLFEGQLEGSLHMGLGYAISEELVLEGGRPKSTRLRNVGILRAKETPDMEIIGVEVPDPHGPYGAKGVGEIGLVPTAGAVAGALYQFDHVKRYTLPMKLDRKQRQPAKNGM